MFIFSVILIIISSYLITSLIHSKSEKNSSAFVQFLLIIFAQIVLSFEILSLFSAISEKYFISLNLLFLLLSIILYKKFKAKLYIPQIKEELFQIKNALGRDKLLKYISIFFIVFLISELILALFLPVDFGDTLAYYLPRCTHWIWAGNLNHYITSDIRELIMPINMDLLYTWHLMFTKNEQGIAVYSYISLLNIIYVVYHLLGELGFCRRKRLWSIYIICAFSIVGVMAYTPLADLYTGSLLLSSVYLFLIFCKNNTKSDLYFSALAFILACGTKSTALMAPISLCVIFYILLNHYKKENKTSVIILFSLFAVINFVIFSGYNYLLNFLQFSNPLSNKTHILLNQLRGGLTGYIYNLVNYVFYIFDLSGINNIDFYNEYVMKFRDVIFSLFPKDTSVYISPYYNEPYSFSSVYNPLYSALGAMGLLCFYPALIYCIFSKKRHSFKYLFLFVIALLFIINILLFSSGMIYTKYNIRYLVTFFIISAPLVVCTYFKSNRNIYRWIVCAFLFIYLFYNPFINAVSFLITYAKLQEYSKNYSDAEKIYDYFIKLKNNKIAVFDKHRGEYLYYIYKLRLFNNQVDKLNSENIKYINLSNYDYIIAVKNPVHISNNIQFDKYVPENYALKCIYNDKNRHEIKLEPDSSLTDAVKVYCKIPQEYIINLGFEPDNGLLLSDYNIYKKKN
jgi:hypothetical protein